MTTVLVVCHANLCRSALGEWLGREAFAGRTGVEIVSAGTHARSDLPMHPYAEMVLREHAIDPTGFRTRRLTEAAVSTADLVLTATREQRSACVALDPAAVRRTMTIPQFGRYAAALPTGGPSGIRSSAQRLRELLDRLSVARAEVAVARAAGDDLADPVGGPIDDFRRCAAEIWPVFDTLARLIGPIPPSRPARHRFSVDQARPWGAPAD
jgi:protein-tyrosine phosphatase